LKLVEPTASCGSLDMYFFGVCASLIIPVY
jgi:hypothetical protein